MTPEKMNAKVKIFKSELNHKKLKIKFFKQSHTHKAVTIKQTLSDLSVMEIIHDGLFSIQKKSRKTHAIISPVKGKNH